MSLKNKKYFVIKSPNFPKKIYVLVKTIFYLYYFLDSHFIIGIYIFLVFKDYFYMYNVHIFFYD